MFDALIEDIKPPLFPMVTIWHRSWVSGWCLYGMTTEASDRLDEALAEAGGFGIIVLGGEHSDVDEDEREIFEEYVEDWDNWMEVEEPDIDEILLALKDRISL
jgi:hypothetical protein